MTVVGIGMACQSSDVPAEHPVPEAIETLSVRVPETHAATPRSDSVDVDSLPPAPPVEEPLEPVEEALEVVARVPQRAVAPERVFYVVASLVNRGSRSLSFYHGDLMLTPQIYRNGTKVRPVDFGYDSDLPLFSYTMQPGEFYGGGSYGFDVGRRTLSENALPLALREPGLYHIVVEATIEPFSQPEPGYVRLIRARSDSLRLIVE